MRKKQPPEENDGREWKKSDDDDNNGCDCCEQDTPTHKAKKGTEVADMLLLLIFFHSRFSDENSVWTTTSNVLCYGCEKRKADQNQENIQ